MTTTAPESGDGPIVCRICGELLPSGSQACHKCGAPVPIDQHMPSAPERLMWLARRMPKVASEAKTVEQLCADFLDIVITAMGAKHGGVWNLESDPPYSWISEKFGALPAVCGTLRHTQLLHHVLGEDCGMVLRSDSLENITDDMLVLSPFSTPVIRSGVIEILQRPDAPMEAGAGYLQFLDQMMVYFSGSPVLTTCE